MLLWKNVFKRNPRFQFEHSQGCSPILHGKICFDYLLIVNVNVGYDKVSYYEGNDIERDAEL